MSSQGTQKIFATKGYEETVVNTYSRLKELIIANTNISFKDVISTIAGITASTYYGYISNVPEKRGRVSLFVTDKLTNYFNLPSELFTGKIQISIEHEKKIISKIKDDFTIRDLEINNKYNLVSDEKDINNIIKKEVISLLKSDDIELLKTKADTFNSYAELLLNRIKDLKRLEQL